METELVKMSEKGQLVVPQEIRESQNFEAGDRFIPFEVKDGVLFKRLEMPDVKKEFEKLSRQVQKKFEAEKITENDLDEAVNYARKSK